MKHHHGHRDHHHRGRPFDYGELRLLVMALLAEQPRHGYELMKLIEERMGGSYSPSPGVMYPTLSWLDDMGYARVETRETGQKQYRVTAEGEAFLRANPAAIEDLFSRLAMASRGGAAAPAQVVRGMENLKRALKRRLGRGPLDQAGADAIATVLDGAAQAIERS